MRRIKFGRMPYGAVGLLAGFLFALGAGTALASEFQSSEHDHSTHSHDDGSDLLAHGDMHEDGAGMTELPYDPESEKRASAMTNFSICSDMMAVVGGGSDFSSDLTRSKLLRRLEAVPEYESVEYVGCLSDVVSGETVLAFELDSSIALLVGNSDKVIEDYLDVPSDLLSKYPQVERDIAGPQVHVFHKDSERKRTRAVDVRTLVSESRALLLEQRSAGSGD